QDLDQRLLSPKLQELADEMQKKGADAERKAANERQKSGNSAAYFPLLLELQQQVTDEWAERLFKTHCEVWRIQGHEPTPDFIRLVSGEAILPLIASRKGTVVQSIRLYCVRTRRNSDESTALGQWARITQKLAGKWQRRLDGEAAASEYRH